MLTPVRSAAALLLLFGCQGENLPGPREALVGTPVALTRFRDDSFAYSTYSGLPSPFQVVIREGGAWRELWGQIHAATDPAPPLPEVDFSREMILAAAMGSRPTGGYDILLARAAEDSSGLEVEVVATSPGPGCITTQALSSPVDLARTQLRGGPVTFKMVERIHQCDS